MNSLKSMPAVLSALGKIATRKAIQFDNGTYGTKIKAYLYQLEEKQTDEAKKLMATIVQKKFGRQDYTNEMVELEKIKAGDVTMVFRLMEPMNVQGTKIKEYNQKNYSPSIKNCTEIYIQKDIIERDLLSYEETGETAIDAQGQEVPVVELNLHKCMLDVKEGRRNRFDITKWLMLPRAYVTDIPYRSMQIVGKLMRRDEDDKYNVLNMVDDINSI